MCDVFFSVKILLSMKFTQNSYTTLTCTCIPHTSIIHNYTERNYISITNYIDCSENTYPTQNRHIMYI